MDSLLLNFPFELLVKLRLLADPDLWIGLAFFMTSWCLALRDNASSTVRRSLLFERVRESLIGGILLLISSLARVSKDDAEGDKDLSDGIPAVRTGLLARFCPDEAP